jgi:hypothetical protein
MDIARITAARSRRESSWDRTGGNDDCIRIDPGKTTVLADITGAGCINHIYFTIIDPHAWDYREAVLRMYWDNEETPSVEVPFGDFFCVGHCMVRQFSSMLVAVNPGVNPLANTGLNCYFPMPFATGARIELANESGRIFGGGLGRVWYHIDYETYAKPPNADLGRFHAQWRRENPTEPATAPVNPERGAFPAVNTTGEHNYVMLEAQGVGQIAGLFLEVDNIHGGWWGEGDDMVFIDGDSWSPSIHGTGTEEVFGGGACPNTEYAGVYSGFLLIENKDGEDFKGKNAMYRWYAPDPIRFTQSVRMTIEHGHANDLRNDYSSVVYWYQHEPHAAFPELAPATSRRPRLPRAHTEALEAFGRLNTMLVEFQDAFVFSRQPTPEWLELCKAHYRRAHGHLLAGEHDHANEWFAKARDLAQANGREV